MSILLCLHFLMLFFFQCQATQLCSAKRCLQLLHTPLSVLRLQMEEEVGYYHIVVHQHALAFYICSIYWFLCPNECCCYYQYVLLNWLYHRLGIANCKVLMVDAIFFKFLRRGWFSWCLSNIFTALNTICFFIMVDFSPHFTVQIIRL